MILEIYDYLLIRQMLIALSTSQILEEINDEDTYKHFVKVISKLIQKEDYPLVYPKSQSKIQSIIDKYRFTYDNKDIISDINYIIGKLNIYKTMDEKTKNQKIEIFYNNEFNTRLLPVIPLGGRYVIDKLVHNDICYFVAAYFAGASPMQDDKGMFELEEPFDYVAMINLIAGRFPKLFEEENLLKVTKDNLIKLSKGTGLSPKTHKYIKRTIKDLEYFQGKNKEKVKRLEI